MTTIEVDDPTALRQLEREDSPLRNSLLKVTKDVAVDELAMMSAMAKRGGVLYLPYRMTDVEWGWFHKLFPEYPEVRYGGSSAIAPAYAGNIGAATMRALNDYCEGGRGSCVVYGGSYLCDILHGVSKNHHCFDLGNPIDNGKRRILVMELSNILKNKSTRLYSKMAAVKFLADAMALPYEDFVSAVEVFKGSLPKRKEPREGRELTGRERRENEIHDALMACETFDELLEVMNKAGCAQVGSHVYNAPSHCDNLLTCRHKANNLLLNHNEKKVGVYQVAAIMQQHSCLRAYASFIFDPKMLTATRGEIKSMGLVWQVVGDELLIHLAGDAKPWMTYKYDEYILLARVNFFEYNGKYYQREITECSTGLWKYVMLQVDEIPSGMHRHLHYLYIPEDTGCYRVISYVSAGNSFPRTDIRAYKECEYIVPSDIVDYAWAQAKVTENLTYQTVLTALVHRNHREITNYASVAVPDRMIDAMHLAPVAMAIYAQTYISRWDDQQIVSFIKKNNPKYNGEGSVTFRRWLVLCAAHLCSKLTTPISDKIGEVYQYYVEQSGLNFDISKYDNALRVETIGVHMMARKEVIVQTELNIRRTFTPDLPGYSPDHVLMRYVMSKVFSLLYRPKVETVELLSHIGMAYDQAVELCYKYFSREDKFHQLQHELCVHDNIASEIALKFSKVTHDKCGMMGIPRCHEVDKTSEEDSDGDESGGSDETRFDGDDGGEDGDDDGDDRMCVEMKEDKFKGLGEDVQISLKDSVFRDSLTQIARRFRSERKPEFVMPVTAKIFDHYVSRGRLIDHVVEDGVLRKFPLLSSPARLLLEKYSVIYGDQIHRLIMEDKYSSPFVIPMEVMAMCRTASPKTPYIQDPIGFINGIMSELRPELMGIDPMSDQSIAFHGDTDIVLDTQDMKISLTKRNPLIDKMRLQPSLIMPSVRVRQPDQPGCIAAMASRNLSVEKGFADQDSFADLVQMFENMCDALMRPTWREEIRHMFADKVEICVHDMAQRLEKLTEKECEDMLGTNEEFDVWIRDPGRYNGMLKSQVKPQSDSSMCNTIPGPQVIVYKDKISTVPTSAAFQEIQRRILSLLKPNVMFLTGKNRDEMNQFLASFVAEVGKWVESDFSKFDKNQQFRALRFEYYVYHRFGLSVDFNKLWISTNQVAKISTNVGIMLTILFQRKSGTSTTLLGNIIVTAGAVTNVFECKRASVMVFIGDDFAMKTVDIPDLNKCDAEMMLLFGLTSKTFYEENGYFASSYIVEKTAMPCFLSDPIKRVACFRDMPVFTRHERGGAYTHNYDLEEKRVSLLDTLRGYEYDDNVMALAACVARRTTNKSFKGNVGLVYDLCRSLYTVASDKELFTKLYEPKPTMMKM